MPEPCTLGLVPGGGLLNYNAMASDRLTRRDHKFIKQYGIFCWAKAVRLTHDDEELGPDLPDQDYQPESPPQVKDGLPVPYGWGQNG